MKKFIRLSLKGQTVLVLAAAAVLMAGTISASWAKNGEIKDSDIVAALETELLLDAAVDPHLIDVESNDGIVTLSGSVDTLLSSDQAVRVCESIKGVRSVVNNITVKPVQRSDEAVREDVENALLEDPAADSYEIKVRVDDAVVNLSGNVDSWVEKKLCERVAKKVKGVKAVENRIDIIYKTDRPDYEIQKEIEARLKNNPFIEELLIRVAVDDGKVTLSGDVGSAAEKKRAYNLAWVSGVRSVNNEGLSVKWWWRDKMRRKDKFAGKSDSEIAAAIKDAFLYDPRVFSFKVAAEVTGGIATLTGTVDNLKAKNAAAADAKNTIGVLRVRNRIKVRPVSPPADAEIARHVRDALVRSSLVESFEISVKVRNQKVSLYGTVDTYYEKTEAGDIASRVPGVAAVQNNIAVNYAWIWKSDGQIKKDIESEFFWSPFVDGSDITVSVDNGVATLTGNVDSWYEFESATENAFEGGANKVICKLRIRGSDDKEKTEYYFPSYPVIYNFHYYAYP